MSKRDYLDGVFETQKFVGLRRKYKERLDCIKNMEYEVEDFIHHFPCFVGHLTLSRFLALYESYRQTRGISGHIAEVGVYKGASLLFFAKLLQIFEPNSLTQVHGFDWFKGNFPEYVHDPRIVKGSDEEPYERVRQLIDIQELQSTAFIHEIDITKDLGWFFEEHPHLQFKMVFLDCGIYRVVRAAIPEFWKRLTKGGHLILDQYNHEVAPGETRAVRELLPDVPVYTYPGAWMPTAYMVK